jgi:hypothetical protein
VNDLLAGHLPGPASLFSDEPKQAAAIENFHSMMVKLQAQPRTHIAYLREAWVSEHDNSLRVTMDRKVRAEAEPIGRLDCQMANPVSVFGDSVILELKFTDRFPDWFGELVRVFELTQCGAAKYVESVTRLGPHAVSCAFRLDDYCLPTQPRSQASPVSRETGGVAAGPSRKFE